jgi:hypothetical protein
MCTKYDMLRNWWRVCLTNGYIFPDRKNENWMMTDFSKKELYNTYNKMCINESYGSIVFWKYFTQLSGCVSKSPLFISLPTIEECRSMDSDYNFETFENAFTPTHTLVY